MPASSLPTPDSNGANPGHLYQTRKEATGQVIVLVISLGLVFLWFSVASLASRQRTFSGDAMAAMGGAASLGYRGTIGLVVGLAVFLSILYVVVVIRLSNRE